MDLGKIRSSTSNFKCYEKKYLIIVINNNNIDDKNVWNNIISLLNSTKSTFVFVWTSV